MDCLPEGGVGYLPSFPESRPGFVFFPIAAGARKAAIVYFCPCDFPVELFQPLFHVQMDKASS